MHLDRILISRHANGLLFTGFIDGRLSLFANGWTGLCSILFLHLSFTAKRGVLAADTGKLLFHDNKQGAGRNVALIPKCSGQLARVAIFFSFSIRILGTGHSLAAIDSKSWI